MSYVLKPSTGGLTNPLTENLDLGSNDIINTATASSDNITITTAIEHQDPAGVVGLYGVPPTPQFPPIADVIPSNPEGVAINEILNALRALGVISV